MRGINFTSAVGLVSELGDLSRFEHPRQLMAWLGVTPSEHSSGGKRRQGSITKTGNSYARKLLVESAWSYRHPARVSIDIQRRHEGLPKPIVDRAWDAQLRLCRRYRKLVARGNDAGVTAKRAICMNKGMYVKRPFSTRSFLKAAQPGIRVTRDRVWQRHQSTCVARKRQAHETE
jgi:hypothetical protein